MIRNTFKKDSSEEASPVMSTMSNDHTAYGARMFEEFAIQERNYAWKNDPRIPSWVRPDDVGLDKFFTRPEVARLCHASLLSRMQEDGSSDEHYRFIEPAAGTGAFYDLLPPYRRVGIDLLPYKEEYEICDFLSWTPTNNGLRNAVIGNPPFGYRAWLALAFVNHAAKFADYVGLILPMAFQSDGKGSPKLRVKGLRLIHSEVLPPDSFLDDEGRSAKVNALWQVWQRGVNNTQSVRTCKNWLDIFTVDMRKERLCGQTRLQEADFFLQRTFYSEPPKLVRRFSDVRYVCGYGLVIKRDKQEIIDTLQNANWINYSNLAAHNCRHISMYHIRQVLTDSGYIDD